MVDYEYECSYCSIQRTHLQGRVMSSIYQYISDAGVYLYEHLRSDYFIKDGFRLFSTRPNFSQEYRTAVMMSQWFCFKVDIHSVSKSVGRLGSQLQSIGSLYLQVPVSRQYRSSYKIQLQQLQLQVLPDFHCFQFRSYIDIQLSQILSCSRKGSTPASSRYLVTTLKPGDKLVLI